MDDLVRWLRAVLDDEAAAQGRPETAWHRRDCGSLPDVLYPGQETGACDCGVPAQALRELGAKRQLLDDYMVTARIRDEAAARIKAAGDRPDPQDLDTWDRAQREAAILEGSVKLAASPLADRPGYRAEWRPE